MQPGDGSGQVASRGATQAGYVNYEPGQPPSGIFSAELATAIVPSGSGSLLSVAAQVVWYPQRSAAERVHAGGYRSATVTVPSGSGVTTVYPDIHFARRGGRTRFPAQPTPRLAAVRRALPCGAGRALLGCLHATCHSLARFVVMPSGCFVDRIRVGGRGQPALDDRGNAVISALHRQADTASRRRADGPRSQCCASTSWTRA